MKLWKIILAAVLACLMLLSVVACGTTPSPDETKATSDTTATSDSGSKDSDTTPSSDTASSSDTTAETSKYDELRALDFGGDTVTFLARNQGLWWMTEAPENTGDVITYSYWNRYNEVQDALNIVIEAPDGENYLTDIPADVSSGANDYDVYDAHMKFGAYLGVSGYNKNIAKLPYVDLTQDYWNHNYTDNFTYKNYVFWTTGDITTDFIGQNVAMYVNDSIYTTYFGGTIDDVFSLVENGQWTLAKVAELCATVGYTDTDGSTSVNSADTFSWVYENTGWVVSAIAYGAGYSMTTLNGSKYELQLSSADNSLVYDACLDILKTTGVQADFSDKDWDAVFTEGRALLTHGRLSAVLNTNFKGMEAYSVVPMPKFSEDSEYITPSYDGVPIIGVLQDLGEDRYDVVGAFLEAEAILGQELCTEAYYETALRAKYAKNEGSYRTIAIVRESAYADFAFSWCGPLNEIDKFLSNNLMGGTSLATAAASSESSYVTLLNKLYTNLGKVVKANG